MGIAADVIEDLLGTGKRRFGIDDPIGCLGRAKIAAQGLRLAEVFERTEKLEFAGMESILEVLQKQTAKQAGQHTNR